MISATIKKDSITDGGDRLTTMVLVHPRPNHADYLVHRNASKNASSSRAIPLKKFRELAKQTPYIPRHWGANQKGMQAFQEIPEEKKPEALDWWRKGFEWTLAHHEEGEKLGLAKQIVNRYLEPYQFITVIHTATDFANFQWLRNHKMADYPMQMLARAIWQAYINSMPKYLAPGEWHLPYIDEDEEKEWDLEKKIKVSTGRCARISYLTHEGVRDPEEDIRLHDDLILRPTPESPEKVWELDPYHVSPAEHPCQAMGDGKYYGNVRGWKQYRKFLPYEAGPPVDPKCLLCGMWPGVHVTTCPNNKV